MLVILSYTSICSYINLIVHVASRRPSAALECRARASSEAHSTLDSPWIMIQICLSACLVIFASRSSSFLGCCFVSIPAAQLPAARLPAVRLPAARLPAARLPAVRLPAARLPAARLPAARLPAARLPATLASQNLSESSTFLETESLWPNGGLARSILAH